MFQYLLKRILLFIPTLLVISLLAFALSKIAPGDPAEPDREQTENANYERTEDIYNQKAARLGLDKPAFYLSFLPKAYPDTLYRITKRYHRENLKKLIAQYGNWPQIQDYYRQLKNFDRSYANLPDRLPGNRTELNRSIPELYTSYKDKKIRSLLGNIEGAINADSTFQALLNPAFKLLKEAYETIISGQSTHLLYIPAIQWHGLENQYHKWFSNFITGDFGISYRNGQPVADRMKEALFWTLIMNGCAILIAYLLSIPLGVKAAVQKDSIFDRVSTLVLLDCYSFGYFLYQFGVWHGLVSFSGHR